MARSVILNQTVRCEHCHFMPRWCICAGHESVELPLQVDVLMHKNEQRRPTSTGKLINRVVSSSRNHSFETESPPTKESIVIPSRYWLRKKQGEESYSTIEALLFLLTELGLTEEEERLRLQFELHVYAGLRSRGIMSIAEDYLASSPLLKSMPELLAQMHERRPVT